MQRITIDRKERDLAPVINETTLTAMEEAGQEKAELARQAGDVDTEGMPSVTIIAEYPPSLQGSPNTGVSPLSEGYSDSLWISQQGWLSHLGGSAKLVPIRSENLKVEDWQKVRDMVCKLNQLFGELNGILKEIHENAEERAPVAKIMQPSAKQSRRAYADKLSVTVEVQANQTSDVTEKQLVEKVDVVGKKIGVRGVKKGMDGAVFVECSSEQ
ncbi:hypothetical protein Trydic_g6777 [Trypoxylus dichotomus]